MAGLVVTILMLISEFGEFLPRVGLCSDIVLGLVDFIVLTLSPKLETRLRFTNQARQRTWVHLCGRLSDSVNLGVPAVAPKS